jgi:hypothetical protein
MVGNDVSFCDLAKANRELESTLNTLKGMIDEVAAAEVVEDSHSERVKQALSKAMVSAPAKSAAQAEMLARVDPNYVAKFELLNEELTKAKTSRLRWKLYHSRLDAIRTQISAQKAVMGL